MVLFNFILGLFVFSAFFAAWAVSFFYTTEIMRGYSLSGLQISSRLFAFGVSTIGLMLSGATLYNGITGLSAFIGLGTIPLLSLSIILFLGFLMYGIYSLYKNKQGTISFWSKLKNSVDGFFSIFDGQRQKENEINEFESKLVQISANVKSFNNDYANSVSRLIGLRNGMILADAFDASGRWKSYSQSIKQEIPVLEGIISAITFSGDSGNTPANIDIRTQVMQQESPRLKTITFEQVADALVRFFKADGSSYNTLISSRKQYIVQSKDSRIIEDYLGDFAKNITNCYLHINGIFLFEGDALIHFIKNTPAIPMIDIEFFSKPDKEFTENDNNKSITGTVLTKDNVEQYIRMKKVFEANQQAASQSPNKQPLNLSMPTSR